MDILPLSLATRTYTMTSVPLSQVRFYNQNTKMLFEICELMYLMYSSIFLIPSIYILNQLFSLYLTVYNSLLRSRYFKILKFLLFYYFYKILVNFSNLLSLLLDDLFIQIRK